MNKILFLFASVLLSLSFAYAQVAQNKSISWLNDASEYVTRNSHDLIVTHTGYSLLFNKEHKQAGWVAYELTREKTKALVKRKGTFRKDPLIPLKMADNIDYTGSIYDRGHLAPAADMSWSPAAMYESFYYSNVSPQLKSFNRGIWKKLEEQVRTWAVENEAVCIVTGPVLTHGLPSTGPDNISIPTYFFKVILDYTEPDVKGIGFIMPNGASSLPLKQFAVSIDSVEKVSGFDFFPLLPDKQEKEIEKTVCIPCWSWRNSASKARSTEKEH